MKTVSKFSGRFLLLVRLLILSLFLLTITRLAAQDWTDKTRFGKVYLASGGQVEGLVQPNFDHNYLLVKIPDATRAYNAWQVEAFDLFDPFSGGYLTFYSLPYLDRGRKTVKFFELVQEGTLTLLSRETDLAQDVPSSQAGAAFGYVGATGWQQRGKTDVFYVLDPVGQITRFYGGRKELLKLMPDYAERIDRFVARHKLSLTDRESLKSVFSYYDSLRRSDAEQQEPGNPGPAEQLMI